MAFLWTLDGRIAVVTRRAVVHSRSFAPADGLVLVADQLRLLLLLFTEDLTVLRIVCYE